MGGANRKLRCKELVFTLLTPGHRVDPKQCVCYKCLRLLRRMLTRHPELSSLYINTWHYCHSRSQAALGPLGLACEAVASIGWSWHGPFTLLRPGLASLPLLGADDKWWDHELRDGQRKAEWK